MAKVDRFVGLIVHQNVWRTEFFGPSGLSYRECPLMLLPTPKAVVGVGLYLHLSVCLSVFG